MPREVEGVAHLEHRARTGPGGQDEDVDVLAQEREDRPALRRPTTVARSGKGRHRPASEHIVLGDEDPPRTLAEVFVSTARDVAEDHPDVLELEVVGLVSQDPDAELVVVLGVEPPVVGLEDLSADKLAHPYPGSLR